MAETEPTHTEGAFRILLTDDNEINRRLGLMMIEKSGTRPDCAGDGAEAVEMHRSHAYDLIFMDCEMPGMNGWEATRELRRIEAAHPEVPPALIVAMTAHVGVEDRRRCEEAGMDDFISKPLTLEAVGRIVAAAKLTRQRPQPQTEAITAAIAQMGEEFGAPDTIDLVESFLQTTPAQIKELSDPALQSDAKAFARAVHSLAGSGSVFGMLRLRQMCLDFEEMIGAGQTGHYAAAIGEIEQEFRISVPLLEQLVGQMKE